MGAFDAVSTGDFCIFRALRQCHQRRGQRNRETFFCSTRNPSNPKQTRIPSGRQDQLPRPCRIAVQEVRLLPEVRLVPVEGVAALAATDKAREAVLGKGAVVDEGEQFDRHRVGDQLQAVAVRPEPTI